MKAVALVLGSDTHAIMAPFCQERPGEETLTVGYGIRSECARSLGLSSEAELDGGHVADLEDFVGVPVAYQADGSFTYQGDFDEERPFDWYTLADGLPLRTPRRRWLLFTQSHGSRERVGDLDRAELEKLCPFALVEAGAWHESDTTSVERTDDGMPVITPDEAWRDYVKERLQALGDDDVIAYVVYHS